MHTVYRFLTAASKVTLFFFIVLCLTITIRTDAFVSEHEPEDKSAAENDLSGFVGNKFEIPHSFFVYAEPSWEAERLSLQKQQKVSVAEVGEDGWVIAVSSYGEGWVNILYNHIYIEHYINSYSEARERGKPVLLPPDKYQIIKNGMGDWILIDTGDEDRWIKMSSIPSEIVFEAPCYIQPLHASSGLYSAATALNALDIDIQPESLLSYVPHIETQYLGTTELKNIINSNFSEKVQASDISGSEYDEIVKYLSGGKMVLLWLDEGSESSSDTRTIAIVGYNTSKGSLIYNDSSDANQKTSAWSVIEEGYNSLGQKALLIEKI